MAIRQAFTVTAQPVGDKRIKFVASTKAKDRHGTRLTPKGCRAENFLKNPVFLWCHNKDGEPDDVIGHVVNLAITEDAVICTVEFKTHRPDGSVRDRAYKCYQDALAGILRAVSVGFIGLKQSPEFKSSEEEALFISRGGAVEVLEWELCELSLCPIGSNPEALAVRSFTIAQPKPQVASVLIKREADGYQLWGKRKDSGKYTTPGGKLNPGEAPAIGAKREAFEEAGLTVEVKPVGVCKLPHATVHCFTATVPDSAKPTSANDPDKEVAVWEWRAQMPPSSELHAVPNAWSQYGNTSPTNTETFLSQGQLMDPKAILEKLGLQEGAKPEEIVAALIKYLAGPDADADKQALTIGLLSMLAPAAPEASAPSASSVSDAPMEEAMRALEEEYKSLKARAAEMETELAKRAEGADKPKEEDKPESPEERADKACKAGQWPMSKRSVLAEQYKAFDGAKAKDPKSAKTPFLFEKNTFSTRGIQFTAGGNPVAKPNLGDDGSGSKIKNDVKAAFKLVERNIGQQTGTNRE